MSEDLCSLSLNAVSERENVVFEGNPNCKEIEFLLSNLNICCEVRLEHFFKHAIVAADDVVFPQTAGFKHGIRPYIIILIKILSRNRTRISYHLGCISSVRQKTVSIRILK